MRGLSSRERVLLALVIAAAIATVFYLFIWTPQNARSASLESQIATRQAELQRLKTLAETREAKEREFSALAERIRLIEAKLPPEREIPNLIRQLQGVASSLKVKLTLLRPGPTQAGAVAQPAQTAGRPAPTPARPGQPAPPPPGPRYQLFRLDLSFEGTYSDLMAFLSRLEDFPRFIVLKQVTITPGELPRLKVTLGAETFVLPRESPQQP